MGIKHQRIGALIVKEVSQMIQTEMDDPKVGFVTLLDCEVTNDYSYAKVFVTLMELGKRIMIRKIPQIVFVIDATYEKGKRIDDILKELKK
ncbi:MAG: ribosome-binding factor A [Erysipelotrichaceae bacterium]|nr:MAG: ribosome-binding factor A [Erysipelotrichaceae bacterium]